MIPTRSVTDDDIPKTWDDKPAEILVSFFYEMKASQFIGSGWRRPRKVRGQWVVRKWADRKLMLRTDRTGLTQFVVSV
ncbi:hypothetical protein [Sulfitobacter sp. R18_1]|uniref:hypothetical protein n=1 Tax=Sulfitobacter sp. R18_1 TaxID=2821104 RepID=UPI001AD9570C|nr:hypothetical protein [Sulfitobacter sp. R18_1]MBO9428182.1 hypothetical protein [Sulfitobacter sp. R18_1]